jgi:hypothetical protein
MQTQQLSASCGFHRRYGIPKNQPFKIPFICIGNLSAGRYHRLLPGKKYTPGQRTTAAIDKNLKLIF